MGGATRSLVTGVRSNWRSRVGGGMRLFHGGTDVSSDRAEGACKSSISSVSDLFRCSFVITFDFAFEFVVAIMFGEIL